MFFLIINSYALKVLVPPKGDYGQSSFYLSESFSIDQVFFFREANFSFTRKGGKFLRNCGAASVGVLQDNLVLSTGLIM